LKVRSDEQSVANSVWYWVSWYLAITRARVWSLVCRTTTYGKFKPETIKTLVSKSILLVIWGVFVALFR